MFSLCCRWVSSRYSGSSPTAQKHAEAIWSYQSAVRVCVRVRAPCDGLYPILGCVLPCSGPSTTLNWSSSIQKWMDECICIFMQKLSFPLCGQKNVPGRRQN